MVKSKVATQEKRIYSKVSQEVHRWLHYRGVEQKRSISEIVRHLIEAEMEKDISESLVKVNSYKKVQKEIFEPKFT